MKILGYNKMINKVYLKQKDMRNGKHSNIWIFITDVPICGFRSILEYVDFKKCIDNFSRYLKYDLLRKSILFLLYSLYPWKNIRFFIMKWHQNATILRMKNSTFSITWELCFNVKATVWYKPSSKYNCWFMKQNVFFYCLSLFNNKY
jgi:hypothetical protein